MNPKILLLSVFTIPFLRADYWQNKDIANFAVTSVPVADLALKPIISKNLANNENPYANITLCWANNFTECQRDHQLLFNEVVEILEEKDKEVRCKLFDHYYYNELNEKTSIYWTEKKNLIYLKDVQKRQCDIGLIPKPYTTDLKTVQQEGILTLLFPFQDLQMGISYSAGTRFTRFANEDNKSFYAVRIIDYKTFKSRTLMIPKEIAIVEYSKDNFMRILKQWASMAPKKIPYVWGGSSFIYTVQPDNFILKERVNDNTKTHFYYRPELISKPYSGMDCSNLILRVAQMCGMPYFYKNSSTVAKDMRAFNDSDVLEEGDLIWYTGHIVIISNVKENEIIECRGYPQKYGTLHTIKVSDFFYGIANFNELIEAHRKQLPLKIMSKDGSIFFEKNNFKILKLSSIYS